MKKEDLLMNIPTVTDDLMQLYVHDKFVGNLTVNQVNDYRKQIVDYIHETDDTSILKDFYFVGHKENRGEMCEELVKCHMDKYGDLSDFPYECGHVRRDMLYLMSKQREYSNKKS